MTNYQYRPDVIEISNTIPRFVTDFYPRFIQFFNDYFTYLESTGKIINLVENFKTNLDPDQAVNEYLDTFINENGLFETSDIRSLNLDKSILIKFLKSINSSCGSENAIILFYKLLFNIDCKINYAKDKLFKLSDSEYVFKYHVLVSINNISNIKEYGTRVFSGNFIQNSSRNSLLEIEALQFINLGEEKFARLEITKPNINFADDETVYLNFNGTEYQETVIRSAKINIISAGKNYRVGDLIRTSTANKPFYAYVSEITTSGYDKVTINSGGLHYKIGDVINIIKRSTNTGFGFKAIVTNIDPNGAISKVDIISSGYNYNVNDINSDVEIHSEYGTSANLTVSSERIGSIGTIIILNDFVNYSLSDTPVIQTSTGTGSVLSFQRVNNFVSNGQFRNETNILGYNYIIQNTATHLHPYSYTIESAVGSNYTKDLIKKYFHTAGTEAHYSFLVPEVDLSNQTSVYSTHGHEFLKIKEIVDTITLTEMTSAFVMDLKILRIK